MKLWRPRPALLVGVGLAALAILGGAWSLASPIASSPDDDFHLATIWCGTYAPDDGCRATSASMFPGFRTVLVPRQIGVDASCFRFQPFQSASCQPRGTNPVRFVASRADLGAYPGAYHEAMSLLVVSDHVIPSVLSMRAAAWVVALGLITASAALAPLAIRRAFVVGLLATCVPLGVFLFASTNPSGTAVAGVASFWCAALALMEAEVSARHRAALAIVAILGAVVAMGSRYDVGVHLAVVSAAVWISSGARHRPLWGRSALLAAVALAGVAHSFRGGEVSGAAASAAIDLEVPLVTLLFENLLQLPFLFTGSLGSWGLGWLDTGMPALVTTLMIGIVAGLVAVGLGNMSRDKWLSTGLLVSAMAVAPMYILAARRTFVGEYFQARYLLPLLPVAVGSVVIGPREDRSFRLSRAQLGTLAAVVVVAHTTALHRNIRRYVTGVDVNGLNLNRSVEWWWLQGPSPMTVWVLGSSAFAVVVAVVVASVLGRA